MESAIVGNIVERKNDKKKENATCNVDFPDKSTAGFPSVFKLKKEVIFLSLQLFYNNNL